MSRTSLLNDLQQLDSTRDAVAAKIAKIDRALRGDKAVREALAAAESADQRLAERERELRRIQDERDLVRSKHKSDHALLYEGKPLPAREVQNLQLEVESLERRLSELDDAALETMEARDTASEASKQAHAALVEAEAKLGDQRKALVAERKRLGNAGVNLEGRSERLRSAIEAADLSVYDRLRASKRGRAVTIVKDGSCAACGMEIPSEDMHRLLLPDGELVRCRGCDRILHG